MAALGLCHTRQASSGAAVRATHPRSLVMTCGARLRRSATDTLCAVAPYTMPRHLSLCRDRRVFAVQFMSVLHAQLHAKNFFLGSFVYGRARAAGRGEAYSRRRLLLAATTVVANAGFSWRSDGAMRPALHHASRGVQLDSALHPRSNGLHPLCVTLTVGTVVLKESDLYSAGTDVPFRPPCLPSPLRLAFAGNPAFLVDRPPFGC